MNATQTPIADLLTLVQGTTAWISEPGGTIRHQTWQGVYHRDIRVLSHLRLTVDGREPPLVASRREGAAVASQVHTVAAQGNEPTALLIRRREVAGDVVEHLEVQVFSDTVVNIELVLELGSDFATLAATSEGIAHPHPTPLEPTGPSRLLARADRCALRVDATGDGLVIGTDVVRWHVQAKPQRPWRGSIRLSPEFDGASAPAVPTPGPPLNLTTNAVRWQRSIDSATADLAALQVTIGDMDIDYIGAGVPWFMALFGRDTLITGYQSLITGTDAAMDVLRALARYQGIQHDDRTLEQPGRILHELRTGGSQVFGLPAGAGYYGTVDATPLFVMLLAEAHRWGADDDDVRSLLPAARNAVCWCIELGDLDNDGFIEYASDVRGLANQGWKDSSDALVHADGTLASGPIALAEVQAYAYAAYLGLAELEERLGSPADAEPLRQRARVLKALFREHYWLPDHNVVALALDGDKRPLAVATSNMGHCLWTGILDGEVGGKVAARLTQEDLTTRWGVRTLARSELAYNPMGYHRGTVWPHDTALVAAGLMRHGRTGAVDAITRGALEACETFGWRMPELFGGLDADEVPLPVPYPAACSPQAWSATAPLLFLRTMLRLDPDVPAGSVHIAPTFSDDIELLVEGIRLGRHTLDLRVRGTDVEVITSPDGLTVTTG